MRVGIISLYHESNTFAPGRTTLKDFQAGRLLSGLQARRQTDWGNHEVDGFVEGLTLEGIEVVPLVVAWALPGPVIEAVAYEHLLGLMLRELTGCGPLDGLLLAPHGAAVSEHVLDVDGDWLTKLREIVGRKIPVVATVDPHANVSAAMVAATDALIAYRTNPHLDQRDRGMEAAAMLVRALRGEISPVQAAALVPMAINIERQHTAESPCAELEKAAREISTRDGILSASILLGFPYADVPEMGSGAVVVADGSRATACAGARELGSLLLYDRSRFVGKLIDPQAAIDSATQLPGPVCLLDMGDNVGGGSLGDGTTLAHLLEKSAKRAFVCLYDPAAVDRAYLAGVGSQLTLEMGGHSGPPYGSPISGRVHVKHLSDGRFVDMRPRHGGTTHYDIGKTAVVETPGGLTVMLTSRRSFPVSIVQLTSCGLDPTSFEVIVAKGVHAPVTAYAEACKTFLRVNTPGITAANLTDFSYRHRRRPLFPFEEPTDGIDRYIVEGNNRAG